MKANEYKTSQLSIADLTELIQYCVRMIPYYNSAKGGDMMAKKLTVLGNAAELELRKRVDGLLIFLE